MFRGEPSDGSSKDARVHRFLPSLAEEKPTFPSIRYQGSLCPGTVIRHSFPMFEKREKPRNRHLFIGKNNHYIVRPETRDSGGVPLRLQS